MPRIQPADPVNVCTVPYIPMNAMTWRKRETNSRAEEMAKKRNVAKAAEAEPAARRPPKRVAAAPAAAETTVQPPASKRQRLQAGRGGRSRADGDAAKPTSWPELVESESFQSEVAKLVNRAVFSEYLDHVSKSDLQKHNLILANLEAFAALLPEQEEQEEQEEQRRQRRRWQRWWQERDRRE